MIFQSFKTSRKSVQVMVAHNLEGLDNWFDVHMGVWPIKKWLIVFST